MWVYERAVGRYFGRGKDKRFRQFDEEFGEKCWRLRHQFGAFFLDFEQACKVYEDAYLLDSFKREDKWLELMRKALQVYDISKKDIESGLDYTIQNAHATHIQDITVRNVFFRRGWEFEGKELVQIRGHNTYGGRNFSPGIVEFHLPDLILDTDMQCKTWWEEGSVEDWYQKNKIIEVWQDENQKELIL
ncbi:hypothetical protein ACFL1H_01060 [Nanoarchaeota archaeon]